MEYTMARPRLLGGEVNETIGDRGQHGLACRGEMQTEIQEIKQILQLTAITVGTKWLQESLSPLVWKGLTKAIQFRTVIATVSQKRIVDASMATQWLHLSTLTQ
jgi:hypothetical protein